jgi:glutathione-regulated potassium-efflux system ancillary protein KefG
MFLVFRKKGTRMNNKVLILFAHPRFERSAINSALVRETMDFPGITFHDLYERYPDFNINTEYEKKLLSEHQVIIWQHPFYWYSAPPLLKQWIDLVLSFGWAYGPGGVALQGKIIFNSLSSGGQRTAYSKEGHNRFTVRELLSPFEQTATLCKMVYLPPFTIHGTHQILKAEISRMAKLYRYMLERFVNSDFSVEEIKKFTYMNDWLEAVTA